MLRVMHQKMPYVTKFHSGTVRWSAVPMNMPRPVTRECNCRPFLVRSAHPEMSWPKIVTT